LVASIASAFCAPGKQLTEPVAIPGRVPPALFPGEPEEIAGDTRTFAAIGSHGLIFDCRSQSIAESIERLQWFATEVIPRRDG
jgi:hypothetical protein